MLTFNMATQLGLVNGTIDFVHDLVWTPGANCCELLPEYMLFEVEGEYSGPNLGCNDGD